MTVRDRVLPPVNRARGIIENLGFRRYTVTIRTRTWSGPRRQEGTATNVDLVLAPSPKVAELALREVLGSGGRFEAGDLRITRITPQWTDGTGTHGYTPAQLNPPAGPLQDVRVVLVGDDGTKVCTIVEGSFDGALGYGLVVRNTRETP